MKNQDPYLNYEGWGSLFVCIVYPLQITPEQAFRSLKKQRWSKPLPEYRTINDAIIFEAREITRKEKKITPEELEKRLQVNRHELVKALKESIKKAPC